jgi:hypothetical protein
MAPIEIAIFRSGQVKKLETTKPPNPMSRKRIGVISIREA